MIYYWDILSAWFCVLVLIVSQPQRDQDTNEHYLNFLEINCIEHIFCKLDDVKTNVTK